VFSRCAGRDGSNQVSAWRERTAGRCPAAGEPRPVAARRRVPGKGAFPRTRVAAASGTRHRGEAAVLAPARRMVRASGRSERALPLDERIASGVMLLVALVLLAATVVWTARSPL